jgi:hypothetical protein
MKRFVTIFLASLLVLPALDTIRLGLVAASF